MKKKAQAAKDALLAEGIDIRNVSNLIDGDDEDLLF